MCILALVSFFPFLVYLALGIYTLSKNPSSILNRRFFISCMGFAIWALGFTLFYMTESIDSASFWIKFARIGFLIQPAALLLFFLALIKEKRRGLQNLLYIPSLFFILEYLSSNVVISNPGVRQLDVIPYEGPWWPFLLNAYCYSYTLISLLLVFIWGKMNPDKKKKQLVRWITGAFVLYVLSDSFCDLFLKNRPDIDHIFALFWAIPIWIIIERFDLMVLTPRRAADEILSNMKEFIFFINREGEITLSNKYTESSLGYGSSEICGKPVNSLFSDNSEMIEKIKNSKSIQIDYPGIYLKTQDDAPIPVTLSTSKIKDKLGNLLGTIILAKDIRQEISLHQEIEKCNAIEKELIREKEKAEKADHLKSAFLANMSHEIRTPMNGILGFAEILRKPNLSQEKKEKYLNVINSSGEHLLNLLNDIINISKIEAGQIELSESKIKLNDVLLNIASLFSTSKTNRKKTKVLVKISHEMLEEDPYILADGFRLKQILINLIGNAIKFSNPIDGKVEFGYEYINGTEEELHDNQASDHTHIRFFVSDNGIGLSPQQQELIFNRFVQADNSISKRYGGAGLGLAITKGLVDLFEGKIWVESKAGKGSTFFFTIPLNKVNS